MSRRLAPPPLIALMENAKSAARKRSGISISCRNEELQLDPYPQRNVRQQVYCRNRQGKSSIVLAFFVYQIITGFRRLVKYEE